VAHTFLTWERRLKEKRARATRLEKERPQEKKKLKTFHTGTRTPNLKFPHRSEEVQCPPWKRKSPRSSGLRTGQEPRENKTNCRPNAFTYAQKPSSSVIRGPGWSKTGTTTENLQQSSAEHSLIPTTRRRFRWGALQKAKRRELVEQGTERRGLRSETWTKRKPQRRNKKRSLDHQR